MKTSALVAAAFMAAAALAKPIDKRAVTWVVTTTTVWEIEEAHTTRLVNEANLPSEVLASLSKTISPGYFIAQSLTENPLPTATPAQVQPVAPPAQVVSAPAPAAPTTTKPAAVVVSSVPAAAPSVPAAAPAAPAAPVNPQPASSGAFSGDMTHYDPGLGACGWTNTASEFVAALPHGMMGAQSNGNPYCGRSATLNYQGRTVTVKIVDKCMGCVGTSIDVSDAAFKVLIPEYNPPNVDPGRVVINWGLN